jgi:hypothetical protein
MVNIGTVVYERAYVQPSASEGDASKLKRAAAEYSSRTQSGRCGALDTDATATSWRLLKIHVE